MMAPTTANAGFVAAMPAVHVPMAAGETAQPIDLARRGARHIALTVLAVVASVAALYVAQAFFVSLLLGIILAYTLNPLVVYLERIKVPRAMGTILVLAGVLGALGIGAYSLRGQVQTIIEQLPEATRTFSTALARLRTNPAGNLQKMQSAAAEVEKATTQVAGVPPPPGRHPRMWSSTRRASSSTTFCSWAPSARSGPWVRRSWCSS